MQDLDLKSIRQRAWSSVNQDGLLELYTGIFFLISAFYFARVPIVAIWGPLVFMFGLIATRRRFTYPRVGYADFNTKDLRRTMMVSMYFLNLVLFWIIYDQSEQTREVLLTICANPAATVGTILAGILAFLGRRYNVPRYHIQGLCSLALGFGIALVDVNPLRTGLPIYVCLMGCLLVAWGGWLFVQFLQNNPVLEGTASDD